VASGVRYQAPRDAGARVTHRIPWVLAATFPLLAQTPTIRTQVPLVLVPVTVTDKHGVYVNDLTEQDFQVFDRGLPQPFHMDPADAVLTPVSMVVAVQTSDISATVLAKLRKVGSMIQPLVIGARGDASILTFDSEVKLLLDFTRDPNEITAAFGRIRPGRQMVGRMIDAVQTGVDTLGKRPPNRRRVLLLISESRDRGSAKALPEVLAAAQREGVAIYPATYSAHATPWTARPSDLPPPGDSNLLTIFTELARLGKIHAAEAFSRGTGGAHLSFATLHTLEQLITYVGEEIHSQYLLSFTPPASADSEFHAVEVRIRDRSDLTIRARPGYWPVH
jgi:VWFA-related protein